MVLFDFSCNYNLYNQLEDMALISAYSCC